MEQAPVSCYSKTTDKKHGDDDVFPGFIGYVDGTYIRIPRPTNPVGWYNRHKYPAMHLQVVINENLEIIHAHTGCPGSMHDAWVYRMSGLEDILKDPQTAPPQDFHLLGDAAYPLKPFLITPFRDDGYLNGAQRKYNKHHSTVRSSVERGIGLLKGKWRKLVFLNMCDLDSMPFIIHTCCVLHNFVIAHGGVDDEDVANVQQVQAQPLDGVNRELAAGQARRNALVLDIQNR